jgi:phage gp29-like protein
MANHKNVSGVLMEKRGIWVSPTEYIDLSELKWPVSKASDLMGEIYAGGSVGGFDPVGWLGLLPDPDPVLLKTGDLPAVLRGLTADDKVISSMQNRKLGTLKKKDYGIDPGKDGDDGPDKASGSLCDDLRQDLVDIDLYKVFSQVLDAPFYGSTPVEIIWWRDGGKLRIKDLRPRPMEWFGYNGEHRPVFLGPMGEVPIPAVYEKLVMVRHFADAVNPYGLRLLSRCLWPVAIKKGGIRFWTTLCERFGMPWVIGHVNGDDTERNKALSQLTAMVQNAVAVVSGDTTVDIESANGKTGDLHPALVKYCDTSIARALQGQSLTNEGTSTGSYAESKTSKENLSDFQEADEQLIVTFMNRLAKRYRNVNAPAAMAPVFRYREPEDYQALAELDTKLSKLGVRFKKERFVRRYRLAEDEFEMRESTPDPPAPPPGDDPPAEFASGESTRKTPSQSKIDAFSADLAKGAGIDIGRTEKTILKAVFEAKGYEDAMDRIMALYPDLTLEGFEALMEQGLFGADMFGRYAEQEGVD